MKASDRSALIRKIEKEMDRIDAVYIAATVPDNGYAAAFEDGKFEGAQEAYSHVIWLLKDTADL
jgi:hypothetical protein